MSFAVLGSGGREHALARRLAHEVGAAAVHVWPGGHGVEGTFACAESELEAELSARRVEVVVIGPEALLERGLADRLRAGGFAVVGPGEADARLETSKAFAKAFMARHGVATAASHTARLADARQAALPWLARGGAVLKYDGLAAGKGVFVCADEHELSAALEALGARYGADAELVIEERLTGRELSVIAWVAGGRARLFPPVEDHKQLEDDDRGPMTGGMGAYYPAPFDTPTLRQRIVADVVSPTLRGLAAEHPDYRGLLFFGLMVTADGPKLLEYNVRFGDPETQVLTAGMADSLAESCRAVAEGHVEPGWVSMRAPAALCLTLAAPGYPDAPVVGEPFELGAELEGVDVLHAATRRGADGRLCTGGGRVLSLVAHGESLDEARARVYERARRVHGLVYRRDVGRRGGTP